MKYFDYCAGLTMTNSKFNKLFGGPPRKPESELTQKEMDIARSVQEVIEEIILKIAIYVRKRTGKKYLCLSGGVALNCVANGRLLSSNIFKDIYIQPAAGDAGGAIGSALLVWYHYLDNKRVVNDDQTDSMKGAYLGPKYSNETIQEFLNYNKYKYKKLSDEEIPNIISDLIAQQKVIGWFQGRMEFGPRALGARTIMGDARSSEMQKIINLKIKYRESFRPFAPSILNNFISEYFDLESESPYMLLVAKIKEDKHIKISNEESSYFGLKKLNVVRSKIPAVTHVDYSARIQSVSEKTNPRYYALLSKFNEKYKCPVIINTSFNVRGEPIVCSPIDAYTCFMRTDMDYLIMNNYLLTKADQKPLNEKTNWLKKFQLD